MLKKTITYKTMDGESVTEDFYFNLNNAELVELELSFPGGISEHLKAISASEDGRQIVAAFKTIIQKAYGKRSENGKRFLKSDELWADFSGSEAYSEFFMSLVTDPGAAAEFVEGVIPKDLQEKVAQIGEQASDQEKTAGPAGPRKLSLQEAAEMDADELRSGLVTGRYSV